MALFRGFNLFVIVPYALHFILDRSHEASWMVGAALVLFSIMMIFSSKKFHANFSEVVMLQLQQEELVRSLEEEQHYTRQLNENLLQEILEKEKYQIELISALEEARQAAIAKDSFFATMSHELRTPLNAIIGFSQILLKRQDLPDPLAAYMEKILISGNRLLDLVNSVLDFSKMRSGKMETEISSISLKDIFNELSIISEPLLQKKSIRFNYPKECNSFLNADRKMLHQILLNLLSNAIKFSPIEGKITLSYELKDEHFFCICDEGVGIEPEDQQSIFDPFTQIKSTAIEQQGTGLGLAIVKEMVHAHGGKIWVESTSGEGSCFYFTIPTSAAE